MLNSQGPFGTAAVFVLISAVLHLLAFVVGGFAPRPMQFVPIGILYVLFALALMRHWRGFAYVVFVIMLLGSIAALYESFGPSAIPGWWMIAIMVADVMAAIFLFKALWKPPAGRQH